MPSGVPGVPDMQLQLGRRRPLCYAAIANTTCELLFRLVSTLLSSSRPRRRCLVCMLCALCANQRDVGFDYPAACACFFFFFLLLLPPETCPNLRPLLFSFYSVAENSNTRQEVAPFSHHPIVDPPFSPAWLPFTKHGSYEDFGPKARQIHPRATLLRV